MVVQVVSGAEVDGPGRFSRKKKGLGKVLKCGPRNQ